MFKGKITNLGLLQIWFLSLAIITAIANHLTPKVDLGLVTGTFSAVFGLSVLMSFAVDDVKDYIDKKMGE